MLKGKCTHCDIGNTRVVEHDKIIPVGRRKVSVSGFLKTVCDTCNYEFVTMSQLDHNYDLLENRSSTVQEAVNPGLLRSIRDRWQITQRQLSKMFAAGESSVGKWEAGATMSGPSALLAQCATHVPGTVEFLAKIAEIELPAPVKDHEPPMIETYVWRPSRNHFFHKQAANSHGYKINSETVFLKVAA